jgi:hypothetical protein
MNYHKWMMAPGEIRMFSHVGRPQSPLGRDKNRRLRRSSIISVPFDLKIFDQVEEKLCTKGSKAFDSISNSKSRFGCRVRYLGQH